MRLEPRTRNRAHQGRRRPSERLVPSRRERDRSFASAAGFGRRARMRASVRPGRPTVAPAGPTAIRTEYEHGRAAMGRGVCGGGVMAASEGVMTPSRVHKSASGIHKTAPRVHKMPSRVHGTAPRVHKSAPRVHKMPSRVHKTASCGCAARTCGPKLGSFGRLVFGFVSMLGGSGVERSRSCLRTRGDCTGNGGGTRGDASRKHKA